MSKHVFTDPADLIDAILEQVNPGPIMVPTMLDQMIALFSPGCAVGFRTESGSLYDMTIYSDGTTLLNKVVHEGPGGLEEVAKGRLQGSRDPKRGVYGIQIIEPSGRKYSTSAIVKTWLAYDPSEGSTGSWNGTFYPEPA
jgi:hypothetical protein